MAGGRPSSFKPEFVGQAEKLAKLGATDAEVAEFFEVAPSTIYAWKIERPEFSEALKRGKDLTDDLVEQSLFRRATGYSHDAVKIFQFEGKPVQVEYVEHTPPDTTACIFWLKNRRPKLWRDKLQQELTDGDGNSVVPVLNVSLSGPRHRASPEAGARSGDEGD